MSDLCCKEAALSPGIGERALSPGGTTLGLVKRLGNEVRSFCNPLVDKDIKREGEGIRTYLVGLDESSPIHKCEYGKRN
jgi:hypothetical protein